MLLHCLFFDPYDRVPYDHVSSMQVGIMSHQERFRLNSNPFMKIAKFLNPITLNAILPGGFLVRLLPTLLCYLLNTYERSFLKVFIISQIILNIFQPFCFSIMLFPDTPNIIPKSVVFFSIWYITWSYTSPLNSV